MFVANVLAVAFLSNLSQKTYVFAPDFFCLGKNNIIKYIFNLNVFGAF